MVTQFCAECGKQMRQTDYGTAFLRCCNGLGYWAPVAPSDGYRLPRCGEYWFYIDQARWPRGMKAATPGVKNDD